MRNKMIEPKAIKFHLKAFKKDEVVDHITTKKMKRISYFIQAVENSEVSNYYLKVTYEPFIDNSGKEINPINDGYYSTKEQLKHAWRCFIE